MTKEQQLAKLFGGKWKFCGPFSGRWECDDGKRAVQRTCCGTADYNGEVECGYKGCCGPNFWLYGDGAPKRVTWTRERAICGIGL